MDGALGDREWYKIRQACEGYIHAEEEPFKDTSDPKYTFSYICESGFMTLKDSFTEIALLASKEIEL